MGKTLKTIIDYFSVASVLSVAMKSFLKKQSQLIRIECCVLRLDSRLHGNDI
jgi:hypothetical protein